MNKKWYSCKVIWDFSSLHVVLNLLSEQGIVNKDHFSIIPYGGKVSGYYIVIYFHDKEIALL